ncbi:MAG: aminoglycoside phosphotransferase family protein [Actinomycetota bacterium]|nr:aminoglycoside phosphotransferase family protein [Actinomycetota bacterium]
MVAADAFGAHVPVFRELTRSARELAWLARLPDLVIELERRWRIRTGSPYRTGVAAWTAPAITDDGALAVLKVSWPHREARGEAAGLRFWAGNGVVRVLRSDDEIYALLLERCEPGVAIGDATGPAEQRLITAAQVLRRLWLRPPATGLALERVGDVTAEWAELVRERYQRLGHDLDSGLVALGAELLESLPATATRQVVVHGDFNPGNVLSARREPWLAIDPKPMIGDPGYDSWPMLTQLGSPFDEPDPAGVLAACYRLFADVVEEPVERLLAWSFARTVESALWVVDRGHPDAAQQAMTQAILLAGVAGL